jgi:hypothetical protein
VDPSPLRLLWGGISAAVLVVMLVVAATHLAWIWGHVNHDLLFFSFSYWSLAFTSYAISLDSHMALWKF